MDDMNITIEIPMSGKVAQEFGKICAAIAPLTGDALKNIPNVSAWINQHCELIGAYRGGSHIAIHLIDGANRLTGDRLAIITT